MSTSISTTNTTFASRLSALRNQQGLSRKALAEAVGVKVNAVHNWEVGKNTPRPKTMKKLSEYFVVYELWLKTGNGPKTKAEQEKLEDEARARKHQKEKAQLEAKKAAEKAFESKPAYSPRCSYLKPEQTREEKILGIVNRSIQAIGRERSPEARTLHRLLSTLRTETEEVIFFGVSAESGESADRKAIEDINQLIGSLGGLEIQTEQKEDLYLYLNEKRSDKEMKLLFK